MLLKKRLIVISLIILLILPLIIYADCQSDISEITSTDVYTMYLKKSLYKYLSNPNQANVLNMSELNSSLYFYFNELGNIDNILICDESSSANIVKYNYINLSIVTKKLIVLPDKNEFPRCIQDGTLYGECSLKKPYFCYSGYLMPMCAGPDKDFSKAEDNCGCPNDGTCFEDTGLCDVQCVDAGDCPPYSNIVNCQGEVLRNSTIPAQCISNTCTPGTPLDTLRDCTSEGKYCSDTSDDCVECRMDPHCPTVDRRFCQGNSLYHEYTPLKCDNEACIVLYNNTYLYQNCTLGSMTCSVSAEACVGCMDDSDCQDTYETLCIGNELMKRTDDNKCNTTNQACYSLGSTYSLIENCTSEGKICNSSLLVCEDTGGGEGECTDGQTEPCPTGEYGVCSQGTKTCSSGSWGTCARDTDPSTEICDNEIDEDCDGSTMTCFNMIIEAEDPSVFKSTGSMVSGGWKFDDDGYLQKDDVNLDSETYTFKIMARGSNCGFTDPAYPTMEFRVDGNLIDTFTVSSTSWAPYTASTDLVSGDHDIAVHFTNYCDNGFWGERILYVDKIVINGSIDSTCTDGATKSCGTGLMGACADGIKTCTGGTWGSCEQENFPKIEVCCNDIDEDCDGDLENGCGIATHIIEAESMLYHTSGYGVSGGWYLDVPGYVGEDFDFNSNFTEAEIIAKSDTTWCDDPIMEFRIGSNVIDTFTVSQSSYTSFNTLIEVSDGNQQLQAAFTNDCSLWFWSNNLVVDKVKLYECVKI